MSGFREQPKGYATKAIHVGQEPEQWTHLAVVPPLVTSTTFKQFSPAEPVVSEIIFFFFHLFKSNSIVQIFTLNQFSFIKKLFPFICNFKI